jgi:signal transduction histidine kinase/HAMP domain-containing protein
MALRGQTNPTFRLGTWLGTGSAALSLLAVLAVAAASIGLLRQLTERQALARVELAGASAREYLRRVNEEVLRDARVLGGRPTLARLLRQRDERALQPFLARFGESSELHACAVLAADGVAVAAGGAVPWPEVEAALAEQGERFVVATAAGMIFSGAIAAVGGSDGSRVVTLRAVNPQLLAAMGDQVGAVVRIVSFATYDAPPDEPFTELHSAAIASGRVATLRLPDPDVYAASVPWFAVTGELVGFIDVEIDAAAFDGVYRELALTLALIALVVVALAAAGGLVYGRWLARPIEALRAAADGIGRGDFSVAVPGSSITEIGSLAATMDEMRRNLVDLTAVLRRRDAEARAVLAGVVEGVYAVDTERVVRYANEQVARTLGQPVEALIGRFCGDVLHPGMPPELRPCQRDCPILAARMVGEGRAAEHLRLADGRLRSVVIVSAPPTEGQQVQVLRDETELESVRRARDGVLANVSHEFRTPLAAQLASIEMLQDGLGNMTTAEQGELIEHLERGVLRLMRLIDNLLESVRIEAGITTIRQQSVDLAETAEEALALVRPLLTQRGQVTESSWPETLPTVVGDRPRLVQVLVNLLANASKYAPAGSAIRIGGERVDDRLVVWVEDDGPGLPDADAQRIFEPFHRAGDGEPDEPGLGLGLWIARSIVERHGGEIGMQRTAAACTRFWFALPPGDPS